MEPEATNEGQPADTSVDASTAPEDNSSEVETAPATLLAGKYKSVEDLEKGYRESTKYGRELNTKVKGLEEAIPKAPENYEFNFDGVTGMEGVQIAVDDPDMQAMLPVFKEINLSNEQASRLVQAHMTNMAAQAETPETIKKQLGSNGEVIVTKLQEFNDGLVAEDQQILQALTDTAAGTEFLYRHLVGGELPTPGPNQDGAEAAVSSAELFKTAFDFKADRSKSIGHSTSEQAEYSKLMRTALVAEENEKKSKK